MSIRGSGSIVALRKAIAALIVVGALVALGGQQTAFGQAFTQTRAVGGVIVDASGMLSTATERDLAELRRICEQLASGVADSLRQSVPVRKVSLRQLDQTIGQCLASGQPLPAEVQYLAGLQQIRYVLADPEGNDVLLVGPAEGWKPGPQGMPVGETTGRPVMLLDDLLVALRAVGSDRPEVISCSIDPTQEGLQRLQRFASQIPAGASAQAVAVQVQQTLGPQSITVTGVPEDSHFARVMVAADYRMKRLGLSLDPAPVANFPGFVQMVRAGRGGLHNTLPRWWMAPEIEPLGHDADGLTWEIPPARVKTLAESDLLGQSGLQRGAGQTDPATQKWAELMTARYDDLAAAEPVFGQLRNCMELAVVAAVIVTQRLPEKAQVRFAHLLDESAGQTAKLPAPKHVACQAVVFGRSGKTLVACGGVQINPWEFVKTAQTNAALAAQRSQLQFNSAGSWWSN